MANLQPTTTRHERARQHPSQLEERYRLLVETIPHGIQECDINGVITFSNPALSKMYGYEEGELIGKRIWDFSDDQTERDELRDYLICLASEQPLPTPRFSKKRTKDGRTIEVQIDWAYQFDENEKVVGFVSAITDITERRRAEEKLHADRLMFQALAETVPAAISIYKDATHQYMNPFGESLTGYSMEELRQMGSLKLIHPDFREMVTNRSLARQRGDDVPDRYEFKFITKAGQQRWGDFSGTRIEFEGGPAVLGVTIDITERKLAEEALRESERRFRTIFEQAAVGVAVIDSTTGEFLQINQRYCDLVGYPLDEMIGNTFQNITHPEDLQTGLDHMASLHANKTRELTAEKRYLRKDGTIVWVNLTTSSMWHSGDEPTAHIAIVEDITERKKSEQALKQAHDELEQRVEERTAELAQKTAQLQAIFDVIPDLVFILDSEDRIVEFQGGCRENLYVPPDQFLGKNMSDVLPREIGCQFESATQKVRKTKGMESIQYALTIQDEEKWFRARLLPYIDEEVVVVTEDIDDRKRAEYELNLSAEIMENMAEGVCLLRASDGVLAFTNPRFDEIFGYETGELIGRHTSILNALGDDTPKKTADKILHDLEETGVWSGEVHNIRKDGTPIWTHSSVSTFEHPQHGTVRVAVVEDITQRKRAEQELRLSSEIMENMAEGVNLVRAADGILVYTNPRFDEIFGYKKGELIGKHVSILNAPSDQDPRETAELIIRETNEKGVWSGDVHNVRKDGTFFWCQATVSTFEHPEFGLVLVAVQEDITGRKETERALEESEKRSAVAQRIAKFGHWEWDIVSGSMYWSDEIYRIFDRKPTELAAAYDIFWETVHPEESELVQNTINDAIHRDVSYSIDHRIVLPDGQTRFVHAEAKVMRDEDGVPIRMVGTVQDITERKRAELASFEKQAQLDNLLSNVNAIILEGDPLDIYFVGGQVEKILGYPKKMWFEHSGGPVGFWSDLLHPADVEKIEICRQSIERGEDHSFEYRLIAKNGKPVWFYDSVTVETRDGKPAKTRSVMIDITERKQAEIASLEKQAQLDDLLSNVGAIIMEGNHLDFYYLGGQVEKILGYPKKMWFEHPQGPAGFWTGLLHPDDGHAPEFCRQAVERGEDHSFEYRLIARDGKPVWFYDYVTVETRDGRPPKVRSIMVDITDRKRSEEEIRQSHEKLAHVMRLSTMGEMATGLAHEINQPLAAISSYCYAGEQALARDVPAEPEFLREMFEKSTVQTLRAGEIIRRLRALVSKRFPVRLQADISQPIQEVLNILAFDLRQNEICVDLQPDHSNRMVTIDEIQIQQVLVNLIRNAIDAMSETDCRERTLTISTLPAADGLVEVAVCDTGKGVLDEEQNQVFDPFFSTKTDGMGMGLAISRTIIESHGGQLWVTSNPDRGVTFHFTLSTVDAW